MSKIGDSIRKLLGPGYKAYEPTEVVFVRAKEQRPFGMPLETVKPFVAEFPYNYLGVTLHDDGRVTAEFASKTAQMVDGKLCYATQSLDRAAVQDALTKASLPENTAIPLDQFAGEKGVKLIKHMGAVETLRQIVDEMTVAERRNARFAGGLALARPMAI